MTSMLSLVMLFLQIPAVIIAATVHEFTRAAVSTVLGDKKPKNEGRLTLNPVKHFEPIGFILMWATGFGWGKPVNTSALFYKNRKRDTLITNVSPIIANLVVAVISSALYSVCINSDSEVAIYAAYLFANIKRFNISLAVYNLLPVAPMDCVKILSAVLPANSYFKYMQYEKVIQMVFLLLLFMGYTDVIVAPIINLFMNII